MGHTACQGPDSAWPRANDDFKMCTEMTENLLVMNKLMRTSHYGEKFSPDSGDTRNGNGVYEFCLFVVHMGGV